MEARPFQVFRFFTVLGSSLVMREPSLSELFLGERPSCD
jgi:hypothetical protein